MTTAVSTIVSERVDPILVAVCLSAGGIPKIPQATVHISTTGIDGDWHAHSKHNKPTRALSLFDEEILEQLRAEGYDLQCGSIGENLTLRGVHVQTMLPGTVLRIGAVTLRLEEPRKPCYVLKAIDERLEHDIVGRCGYMASVLVEGDVAPGTLVEVVESGHSDCSTQPSHSSGRSI